jgi:hypothetical protein
MNGTTFIAKTYKNARFRAIGLASVAVLTLASCATDAPAPPPEPILPTAPAISIAPGLPDAAAVYVTYVNTARNMTSEFTDPQNVQASLQQGAAYEPKQLARGTVAFAALVALQDPELRTQLRNMAADETIRTGVVQKLYADPRYAMKLPGAESAARRVITALSSDAHDMYLAGSRVKQSAYDIQKQPWSKQFIPERDQRLVRAKQNSVTLQSVNADASAKLLSDALAGNGLSANTSITLASNTSPGSNPAAQTLAGTAEISTFGVSLNRESLYEPPYTPAVSNAVAIAALTLLGEGSGRNETLIMSLLDDGTGPGCLGLTKLNLYQCLAVAKPNYEDVFCIGQHELMDTGQCIAKIASYALNTRNAKNVQAEIDDRSSARAYLQPPKKKAVAPAKKKKKA